MKEDSINSSRITSLGAPLIAFLLLAFVHSQASLVASLFSQLLPDSDLFATRFVGVALWLSGAWLAGRAIDTLVLNPVIRSRTGAPAPSILSNVVSATLFVATVFCIIKFVFERPVGGLLATSGIVTVIIGFAIRDMIADFFSGLAMNIEQPYRIGDWLELDGVVARVTEMNWRATRLITQSRKTVVVPNNNLAVRQFANISRPERYYRESLELVLNYTTDPARIENILLAAIHATEGLATQRHDVRITGFQERGVVYQIRFWVNDYTDKVRLRHRLAANVLEFISQAGISIPYAQHEIVLTRERKPRKERRINARRLLSRVSWLEMLTDDELEQLAAVAVAKEYDTGRDVVRQDDIGSSLYVLVEGVLEVFTRNEDGKDGSVGKIQPGQAFGEMSLLTGSPRVATVRAITDVYVLEIRREDLEPILRARPAIAEELGQIMARRQYLNEHSNDSNEVTEESEDFRSRALHLARRISHLFGI
ncbi:MAG: mechanosensitive ion channel [Gammaproteobacteria bacterium]|nr:mechanosensitive ion channel [Gammaproteobacteria bacterium]NNM21867.1 mechanosensitive ion channel [Gammaproteobacteria bacterium]